LTAIELATVVTVLAVLSALAAPSFAVVMCRSDAPEAASPTCGSGSGPGGYGWVSGWIIFEDRDNSGAFNAGDQLLRVQGPIRTVDAFLENGGSSSTKFPFTPTGRLRGVGSATQLQVGSNDSFTNTQQRTLCVSQSGRVRVVGDGYASCSTATDR
jgi:type IV fimbrial biogenesis protein FimT